MADETSVAKLKPDDDEGSPSLIDQLLGAALSPEGLTELGKWRDAWKELEKERLALAKDAAGKAHRRTLTFVWLRYVLSALVVGAIWALGHEKILESQALIALLGGVVGSLFVQPGPAVSAVPAPPRVGPHIGK